MRLGAITAAEWASAMAATRAEQAERELQRRLFSAAPPIVSEDCTYAGIAIRTHDDRGRLDSDTVSALRTLPNMNRLNYARVRLKRCAHCGRRFIGDWSRRGCSKACVDAIQAAKLAAVTIGRALAKKAKSAFPHKPPFSVTRQVRCDECRKPIAGRERDRRHNYCSAACRQTAYRMRRAG